MRSRNGHADLWLTVVWVTYLLVFRGTIIAAHRAAASTWRTGSISPSSSPSRCCISAITPPSRVSVFSPKSYIVWSGVQDAMVQWWYGHNAVGFLPYRRLLAIMYYFYSETPDRAGLFLSTVDHSLLGADLPLYLGWAASSALHGAAGLGADARHDVLDHAVDALMGRHDQRHHDAVGRLGQTAHRSCACA